MKAVSADKDHGGGKHHRCKSGTILSLRNLTKVLLRGDFQKGASNAGI
jgi:hypothetical protein